MLRMQHALHGFLWKERFVIIKGPKSSKFDRSENIFRKRNSKEFEVLESDAIRKLEAPQEGKKRMSKSNMRGLLFPIFSSVSLLPITRSALFRDSDFKRKLSRLLHFPTSRIYISHILTLDRAKKRRKRGKGKMCDSRSFSVNVLARFVFGGKQGKYFFSLKCVLLMHFPFLFQCTIMKTIVVI